MTRQQPKPTAPSQGEQHNKATADAINILQGRVGHHNREAARVITRIYQGMRSPDYVSHMEKFAKASFMAALLAEMSDLNRSLRAIEKHLADGLQPHTAHTVDVDSYEA